MKQLPLLKISMETKTKRTRKKTAIAEAEETINIPEIEIRLTNPPGKQFDKIGDSIDCYKILKSIFKPGELGSVEQFVVLFLNRANKIKGFYRASKGGITGTVVDVRTILATALKSLSVSMIVCHNHPSGNLKPSDADVAITKQLKEAGKIMDIALLDHLILTEEHYYSFADEGRL
jgi:DNA repair protein RadC